MKWLRIYNCDDCTHWDYKLITCNHPKAVDIQILDWRGKGIPDTCPLTNCEGEV